MQQLRIKNKKTFHSLDNHRRASIYPLLFSFMPAPLPLTEHKTKLQPLKIHNNFFSLQNLPTKKRREKKIMNKQGEDEEDSFIVGVKMIGCWCICVCLHYIMQCYNIGVVSPSSYFITCGGENKINVLGIMALWDFSLTVAVLFRNSCIYRPCSVYIQYTYMLILFYFIFFTFGLFHRRICRSI